MLIQQFGIDIVGVDNKTTVTARVLSVYRRYATLIFSLTLSRRKPSPSRARTS
jgi:hypothetical protein